MSVTLLFLFTIAAYFVKAVAGFGDTLVMSSLFSFVVPNTVTTPVNLLISIPVNAYMTVRGRKSLSLKIIAPLSVTLLAGTIPGIFLLTHMSGWLLKAILGLVVVGLAMEMLLRRAASTSKRGNPVATVLIGIASGLLCGMFGIGALLAAYVSRTAENRSQFRSNLCCVFLLDNLFRLAIYIAAGIFTGGIFRTTLLIVPAVVLGMFIGIKVDLKLKERTIRLAVVCLLLVSGAFLFLTNIVLR